MKPKPTSSAALLMLVGVALPCIPHAAQAQVVLVYDQTHRKLYPDSLTSADALEPLGPARFRLRHPAKVTFRVINTNTALYRMTASIAAVEAPVVSPLQAFTTHLKPFLPDIATLSVRARGPGVRGEAIDRVSSIMPAQPPSNDNAVRSAWLAGRRVEADLRRIDAAVTGPRGVNATLVKTLVALDAMQTRDASAIARTLRDSLGLPPGDGCSPMAGPDLVQPLLAALADLPGGVAAVDSGIGEPALETEALLDFRDGLRLLDAGADSALRQSEMLVGAAYHTQRLSHAAINACSHWSSDTSKVTATTGQEITLRIDPRLDAELARVAGDGAVVKVTVLPPAGIVEPSLGLSLLDVPNARFAKYGVRSTAAGANEVFAQTYQDARFSWGVTLGLTWRPLNWSSGSGWAVWLPELTVGESSDQKELGLGAGLSFHLLKLGFGGMWMRHTELVGSSVGSAIASKDALQTRDTYGSPMFYTSLSIFDWPPFTGK